MYVFKKTVVKQCVGNFRDGCCKLYTPESSLPKNDRTDTTKFADLSACRQFYRVTFEKEYSQLSVWAGPARGTNQGENVGQQKAKVN